MLTGLIWLRIGTNEEFYFYNIPESYQWPNNRWLLE
jgi:hypothetical protein